MRRSVLLTTLSLLLACTPADKQGDTDAFDERGARVVPVAALGHDVAPRWETELVFSTAGRDSLGIGDAADITATFLPDTSRVWHLMSPQGESPGEVSLPVYTTALFPARTELLDAAGDRLAVLRELPSGEVVIEVRMLKRSSR